MQCSGTGYRGRVQVAEVLAVSAGVRDVILRGAARDEVRAIARDEGMETLRESALGLALDGTTSLEECSKVFL
jgi:type II secretory ATPase GspE/PulE/Tfp pilus assembly ATPase PilB-like protein